MGLRPTPAIFTEWPLLTARPMHVDVFCRVIDNYGDIGVCWRLARRLAHGHNWQVRLWVDDLNSFARIEPCLLATQAQQPLQGIEVVHWRTPAPALQPGDIVIEAFGCDPPADFIARMQPGAQTWINLEYLSAEAWVDTFHGLSSPQPGGLVKYFFFPGFTAATGGLLREPGLMAERDAWQTKPMARQTLLARLGVAPDTRVVLEQGGRLAFLFCYPEAPIDALLRGLAHTTPTVLLVPQGVAPTLDTGRYASVQVVRIPFVSQTDFDRLLWSADFNLVRGEDSFVRALWAGRPMLWHIYPQDEAAHLAKLDAWLACHKPPAPIAALMRAWNGASTTNTFDSLLRQALAPTLWGDWLAHTRTDSRRLAARIDLADALVDFCGRVRKPTWLGNPPRPGHRDDRQAPRPRQGIEEGP